MKNYGFNEELVVIEPEAYILGGKSKVPTDIFRPDGQWKTPIYEPQAEKYETAGCTVWGAQNQIEIFFKEVFGFEPNYDERFIYQIVGIRREDGGTNPQNVYESIRKHGLIDNEPMPETYDEFTDRSYLTVERLEKGKKWIREEYDFYHDWLSDTSKETIKSALMLSPIAISVTAWQKDKDGLYISNGEPNGHWCVVYGYKEEHKGKKGIFLKVFDSYDHSKKILHPDHHIAVAKRIYIRKRVPGENPVVSTVVWSLFKFNLVQYIRKWYNIFTKQ